MAFTATIVPAGNEEGIAPNGYGSDMPYEYNGNLYVLTIKATSAINHFVHISKSSDGGHTWSHLLDGPNVATATDGIFRYVNPIAHARLGNIVWFFYENAFGAEAESGFIGTLSARGFDLTTETLTLTGADAGVLPYRYYKNIVTLTWVRVSTSGGAGKIRAWARPDGTILVVTEGRQIQIAGDTIIPSQVQDYASTFNGVTFTTPTQIATGNNPQYSILSGVCGTSGITHVIVRETTSPTSKVHYGQFDQFNVFSIKTQIYEAGTLQENYCYFQNGQFYLCHTTQSFGVITFSAPRLVYGNDNASPALATIEVPMVGLSINDLNRAFSAIFPVGGCWCCYIVIRNTADPSYRVYRSRRHSTLIWEPFQLIHSSNDTHSGLLGSAAFTHSGLTLKMVYGVNSGLYTLSTSPDFNKGGVHFSEVELSASSTCGTPEINVSDAMSMSDSFQKTLTNAQGNPNNPPISIDECPDIVASSACAFVKTINDSEDPLTDCEEEIFSESGEPCHDE